MAIFTQPEKTAEQIANERVQLNELKQILLGADRSEVQELKSLLDNKEQLSDKVSPIIQEHLDFLKKNFEAEYETTLNKIFAKKLESSQDDLLNILYPVMGKMIRKFIANEFQKLKEGIDQQMKTTFSRKGILGKFSFFFSNSNTKSKEILAAMDVPLVEEIFLIQKDSGLLIGHAANNTDVDADVIAGMFTAIKAFVEDAFHKKSEELEMIEYGTYKIFVQSFHSYYMAAAISGSMSSLEREQLAISMNDFAEKEMKTNLKIGVVQHSEKLSELLRKRFLEDSYEMMD